MTKQETRKITLSGIAAHCFGALFLFGALGAFTSGKTGAGFFFLLAGLAIYPPFLKFIKNRFDLTFSRWVKVAAVFIFLSLGTAMLPTTGGAPTTHQITPSPKTGFSDTFAGTPIPSPSPSPVSVNSVVLGEPFQVGDYLLAIFNLKQTKQLGDNLFSKKEARIDAKFVVFDVLVENLGDKSVRFGTSNLRSYDAKGRKFDVALSYFDNDRLFDSIEPGLIAHYKNFYIEVPEELEELTLVISDSAFFASEEKELKLDLREGAQ